jgi:hypothetical protein
LNIWRAWAGTVEAGNLAEALTSHDIEYQADELHNAGNDAWYTMQLLTRLADVLTGTYVPKRPPNLRHSVTDP